MARDLIPPILTRYNLKEIESMRVADGGASRSHLLVVEDMKENKYALKLFDSEDSSARERFLWEIKAIKNLRIKLSGGYRRYLPKIKWYSTKGHNPYFIYKYFEGVPIGEFIRDFGIKTGVFRHNGFYNLLNFFEKVEKVDVNSTVDSWGHYHIEGELKHYFNDLPELVPADIKEKVLAFIDKNEDLSLRFKTLAHGDVYPENILISKFGEKDFFIIDWEYFRCVPIGFIPAFIYLLFWREDFWRKKIFSYYYNKYAKNSGYKLKGFLISFRFCLIVLAIRFIYQIDTYGDKTRKSHKEARSTWISDIEKALNGKLVSPRDIKFVLTIDDVVKVGKLYGIEDIKNYYVYHTGRGNTVIKVDTEQGKKYVFRFYSKSRSKAHVRNEIEIYRKLSNSGMDTYKVIKLLTGECVLDLVLYGRKRKVAVLTYIKGAKIKSRWSNEVSSFRLGKVLRSIHDAGVIHGDFSKENVLFVKSRISGVIDFEWGKITDSKTAKFNDMVKAIALWLTDIRSRGVSNAGFIEYFLKGYMGELPEGDKLKRILDAVIIKVQEERGVFLRAFYKGSTATSKSGRRFIHAIKSIRELQMSIKETSPSDIREHIS